MKTSQGNGYGTQSIQRAGIINYGSLVLGRERQHCSLNTITCEARPFSIRF